MSQHNASEWSKLLIHEKTSLITVSPFSPGVSNIIQTGPRTSALAEQLPPLNLRAQPGLAPGFWLCVLILNPEVS